MEKLVVCWFFLLTLLSLSSGAAAQDTFPVGAIIGIVFGIFGVCFSFALPVGIWICILCGATHAARRQNQRPVNAFVVQGNAPQPPPGSYPSQPQPSSSSTTAYPSAYPAQPAYPVQQPTNPIYPAQQPTNPAYPTQPPSAPYPSAPAYPTSQYTDALPPYAPPTDSKQPL